MTSKPILAKFQEYLQVGENEWKMVARELLITPETKVEEILAWSESYTLGRYIPTFELSIPDHLKTGGGR